MITLRDLTVGVLNADRAPNTAASDHHLSRDATRTLSAIGIISKGQNRTRVTMRDPASYLVSCVCRTQTSSDTRSTPQRSQQT
jgi:hypothetical protein